MLSKSLEDSLHRSLALANSRNHEFATLEHLLLALTEDGDAVELMCACGVNLSELKGLLDKFIDDELVGLVVDEDPEDARATAGFQRVIQRAVHHVQMSGRDEVTGANVLVAIFSERESHAIYLLQKQNMTRLDAVRYISHGISKTSDPDRSTVPSGTEEQEDETVKQGQEALEAYCV
ncbi:MAG: ATP-dependent Clp protease ATP-binding subunit ClpA, partial [Candidatus Poribacteria bacterium]|nr:ATP-dependent Clp protease ATP-binding subunit ClpA [Candidatus Poribacteria bacterium]